MSLFINETPAGKMGSSATSKCEALLSEGAKEIPEPVRFQGGLVCVVDSGHFGAAGYADSERQMNRFKIPDGRAKRWFIWDKAIEYAV